VKTDASRLKISYRVTKGKAIPLEEQALLISVMEEVVQRVNENNARELDKHIAAPKQA
jgi:hypothetical protein